IHQLRAHWSEGSGGVRARQQVPGDSQSQRVAGYERDCLSSDGEVGADREGRTSKNAVAEPGIGVRIAAGEPQRTCRLPAAVELDALAARRRQVGIADAGAEGIEMDLVRDVGAEERRAQCVAAGTPLDTALVRSRVLGSQDLELIAARGVELVDLLGG